jgi:hypothetical protein
MARRRTRPSPASVRKQALAQMAAYDPATNTYTGQRAANDPWLNAIMDSGRDFWASRNVALPERIRLEVADDLRENDQEAWMPAGRGGPDGPGEGTVILDSNMLGQALARARSRRRPTAQRRVALQEIASTLLHEMGHTGQLQHTDDDGFMSARGGSGVVPQETMRTIRRLIPRRKGEKATGVRYGIG